MPLSEGAMHKKKWQTHAEVNCHLVPGSRPRKCNENQMHLEAKIYCIILKSGPRLYNRNSPENSEMLHKMLFKASSGVPQRIISFWKNCVPVSTTDDSTCWRRPRWQLFFFFFRRGTWTLQRDDDTRPACSCLKGISKASCSSALSVIGMRPLWRPAVAFSLPCI